MYKKQLGLQKILCLAAVILAAVWFVYCLGMITDVHDALRFTMLNDKDRYETKVVGSILFYDMQPFITTFQSVSIGLILLGCLLYITNTHTRRRYYISNYIAVGLYSVASLAAAFWVHSKIDIYTWRFKNEVDFPALLEQSKIIPDIKYNESTFLLDLHYALMIATIIVVVGLIANTIFKVFLMRTEKQLLEGADVSADVEAVSAQRDRMLYTKDKTASFLALVAIVLDVLYFVAYYQMDVGSYYYTWMTGASVIYNLLFMLFVFLASESMKNRNGVYNKALMIVGAMQFVRMLYLPAKAIKSTVEVGGKSLEVISAGKYAFCLVVLAVSGICCIAAALVNSANNKKLAEYKAQMDKN